jgi:hypothetical protein
MRDIGKEKHSLLSLKLTTMDKSVHKYTLQLTYGFSQHTFGGTSRILEAWRVGNFNLARQCLIIFKYLNRETKKFTLETVGNSQVHNLDLMILEHQLFIEYLLKKWGKNERALGVKENNQKTMWRNCGLEL